MAYKALYRKYRPIDFEDFTGQKHVLQTLKNSIEKNKIAHAYLFSGPRGTGKTSMAKLFAKAIVLVKINLVTNVKIALL